MIAEGDWGLGDLQVEVDDYYSRVLPEYWNIRNALRERYNAFGGHISPNDRDGLRGEAKGGNRFVSTLDVAMDRTRNAQAVGSIYEALEVIVDRPHAGETAWEMRRFIRRAPAGMIGEFGVLMKALAERTSGVVGIDMDFYYYDCEGVDPERVERLSRGVLDGLRSGIDCINPEGTV